MHIEIPDGIITPWIWIFAFVVVFFLLALSVQRAKKEEEKLPLAALFSALGLLVMSIPLGLPIHINLMVLFGILLGPSWALIVAFTVNVILAFLGHGGVTAIGLNTLLLWAQAVFGYYLFYVGKKVVSKKAFLGSVAAFMSLFLSFIILTGFIYLINLNPEDILIHDHDHNGHNHEEIHHNGHSHDDEIDLFTFITVAAPIFFYAAIIEATVVGFSIAFIEKGKPELL